MNMVITERDKKLLGFLAAFVIALGFFLFVLKPLGERNVQINSELKAAKELEAEFGSKASGAQDMARMEEQTKQQLSNVLARFYPVLQSQNAEKMVTTLMLNHNMSIQSLTVVMPETASIVKWYQYSDGGRSAEIVPAGASEDERDILSLYAAKVACVIEGSDQDLWELVDDISDNYPAISITSAEWTMAQQPVVQMQQPVATPIPEPEPEPDMEIWPEDGEAVMEDAEEEFEAPFAEEIWTQAPVTETVKTNRLTISFEIYMCNQ